MKTKKLSFLFVALVAFGTTTSAFAQYGWNGYRAVRRAPATQRQAPQQRATKAPSTNARTNDAATASVKSLIPKTRLLAFGIDKYPSESGLGELYGCVNDAKEVKNTFDYADSALLTDKEATSKNISDKLEETAKANYGRLIVFFGCHGFNFQGRSFICPFDARITDENKNILNGTKAEEILEKGKEFGLIPLVDILNALKGAKAKEVLVIFDACRVKTSDGDGDFVRELVEIGREKSGFSRQNEGAFAVLTSCSVGQEAREIIEDGRDCGSFTYYFLEGISSGLADYAGLTDGRITLVEAYNYAASKTATRAQKELGVSENQTPERYMSNVSEWFVLKELEESVDLASSTGEKDLQFLARTGNILANVKWAKEDNEVGLKALDCVLKNIPNDVATRGSRAAVRRKLGDYVGALDDYSQIGEKFQLYATSDREKQDENSKSYATSDQKKQDEKIQFYVTQDQEKQVDGVDLKELDLLTITQIDGERYYVSEVNNDASKHGWIDKKNAGWNLRHLNGSRIATGTATQGAMGVARNAANNGSMISPGRGAVGQFSNFPGPLSVR